MNNAFVTAARRRHLAGLAIATLAWLATTMPGVQSQTQAIPRIADIAPKSVVPGSGDFTLTVRGTGLLPGQSRLTWNGVELANTVCVAAAPPQLASCSATVPAANVATRTTATVTVVNPGGAGQLISNATQVTVTSVLPAKPHLTDLTPVGVNPRSLAVGDFNRDGFLDAATANAADGSGDSISVGLGNGSGHFAISHTIAMPNDSLSTVVAADVNEDGILDLVTYSRDLTVLLGNGDGTFEGGSTTALSGSGGPLVIGDFTGDGHLDAAVQASGVAFPSGPMGVAIHLLAGDGAGGFTLASTLADTGNIFATSLSAGDFDGDGRLDLAVPNWGAPNDPTGHIGIFDVDTNGAVTKRLSLPAGARTHDAAAADLNGDGVVDLVAVNHQGSTLTIYYGDGLGGFTPGPSALPTGLVANERVNVADINGDGRNDIVTTGCLNGVCTSGTAALINDGAGSFAGSATFFYVNGNGGFTLADVHGDGRLDWVSLNAVHNAIAVHPQAPELNMSTTAIDFGSQTYLTPSAPRAVTLTVFGSAPLTISKLTTTGDFSIGSGGTCPTLGYVEPGTCTIEVIFTPTAEGFRSGTLTIEENEYHNPNSRIVALSGSNYARFRLVPDNQSHDFGMHGVGITSAPFITMADSFGDGPVTISNVQMSGPFQLDRSACPAILLPHTSCPIAITFTAPGTGFHQGYIQVDTNAGSRGNFVYGTGFSGVAQLSPVSLTFAPQGLRVDSAAQTVTLTNTHTTPLNISSIGFTGSYAGDFAIAGGTCPVGASTLAPAASCTLHVVFRPLGRGARTATLSVASVGGLGNATAVSGTGLGNGIPFVAQLAPASLAPGGSNTPLSISGTGFVSGAQVLLNGTPIATTFVDAGHLTATMPAAAMATANTARVTVRQPAPGSEVSNVMLLPIATVAAPVFARTDVPVGVGAQATAVGDFNGDGVADIATTLCGSNLGTVDPPACTPGAIAVRLGTGTGSFGAPRTITMPDSRSADRVLAADFTGDGKLDLAVTHSLYDWSGTPRQLSILIGDGTGQFAVPTSSTNFSSCSAGDLVAADFTGDGSLDLAVGDPQCQFAGVWEGDGAGRLRYSPGLNGPLATLYTSPDVAPVLTDVTGDGQLDVVTGLQGGVIISADNGTGTFPTIGFFEVQGDVKGVAAADVNGDGDVDVVLTKAPWDASGNTLEVFLGDGTGVHPDSTVGFSLAQSIPLAGARRAPVVADFDGDGIVDIAVASDSNTVSVLLGDGTGQFTLSGAPQAVGSTPHSLVAADVNGDGRLDLLTTNDADGSLTVLTRVAATATPTVSLVGAPAIAAHGATFAVTAKTNANVMPTIEATGACSVSPVTGVATAATATVSMTRGAGTCNLTARWPTSGIYKAASATASTRAMKAMSALAITTSPSPSAPGQPVTVTFTATGGTPAPSGAVGVVASTGEFCLAELQAGTGSCVLTFSRNGASILIAAYVGDDNFLPSLATRSHTVNGPIVTLTTPSFGNVKVGRTVSETIKLSNTGTAPAALAGMSIGAPGNAVGDYALSTNCGATLAAKASCTITVRFTARSVGVKTATVIVTSNAGTSPHTAALTATVVR